jgi:geranylgeranyl diphosphate synthase type II
VSDTAHWNRRTLSASAAVPTIDLLSGYLEECRSLVLDEIREIVPRDHRHSGGLYELIVDYPLRGGKALRPALCIATCRALGGSLAAVLRSAAVLELYHNAFLVHDDVEDGSEKRRHQATLHRLHGVPIAVNVGDGMLALALRPLLDNMRILGLGRALRILEAVADMARESAEGQMLELDWIRRVEWTPAERDYVRMVHKKSAYYTFVTPVVVGAIAAGAGRERIVPLRRFATQLGVAFQIQDDVLNLAGAESSTGKEEAGDLWEGKHTLILIHALRNATTAQRVRALKILRKQRVAKTETDVRFLCRLIERSGGVEYALAAARRRARRASRTLASCCREVPRSVHRDFLEAVVNYVVERDR